MSIGVNFLGFQNHVDLVGPTSSAGADGIQDLQLQLTNLPVEGWNSATDSPDQTIIDALTITGPSGFTWDYTNGLHSEPNNPQAGPAVQVTIEKLTSSSTSETVDVFFSPKVQHIDATTGAITDSTLPSNSQVSVNVTYTTKDDQGTTTTEDGSSNPSSALNDIPTGTTDPAPADPAPPVPVLSVPSNNTVTFGGQDQSTGMASITISGLSTTVDFAMLSDEAGLEWEYSRNPSQSQPGYTYGRPPLGMTIQDSAGIEALTFPPMRDEAGSTMTLTYELSKSSVVYVSDINIPAGDHTDPSLLSQPNPPISQTPLLVSPADNGTLVSYLDANGNTVTEDMQTLLDSAGSGTNNFELASGTYEISQPLMIEYPMTLQGVSGSMPDLEFTFSGTTSPDQRGAINLWVSGESLQTSHVTLKNFEVSFLYSNVTFSNNDTNAAIINDEDPSQTVKVGITIEGLTIRAPEDTNFSNSNYENGKDSNGLLNPYAIDMGPFDSGTIEGNYIYGGTISVTQGPWTISDNHFIGSVPGTICLQAIGVGEGHDVMIQNNYLTNPDAYSKQEQLERLVTLTNGGYNITIDNNHISTNVGLLAPAPNATSSQGAINAPEMILPEDYGIIYEGSTQATTVSSSSNSQ